MTILMKYGLLLVLLYLCAFTNVFSFVTSSLQTVPSSCSDLENRKERNKENQCLLTTGGDVIQYDSSKFTDYIPV